jgi:chemotaxis protein methyltransferase WspC
VTPGESGDARAISLIGSLLRSRGAIAPELLDARTIESLARARCAAGAATSIADYARMLESDALEADRLLGEIAVPETWFFRYLSSFDALRALLEDRAPDASRRIRILSVGCAGGCEPVSIAVTALSCGIAPERIEVIAADRNPKVVRDAQAGRWPAHALREGLPAWAGPWIRASAPGPHALDVPARVDAAVLSCIRWHVADATATALAEDGSCDAVFCRNVLIYLDAAARESLLRRMVQALAPDGILFLGHAESMVGREGLESAGIPGAFAWRRSRDRATRPATRAMAAPAAPRRASPSARTSSPVRRPPAAPQPAIAPRAERASPVTLAARTAEGPVTAPDSGTKSLLALAQEAIARRDEPGARRALLQVHAAISAGDHGQHADEVELAAGLLYSVGELDAAFSLYSRIAFVNPAHERALLAMAEISESCGRPDEASRYRERLRRVAARQDGEPQP